MSTVADWVEQGLAAATADDCVVVVEDRRELNLRFANNALTTNGAMRSCQATVVAIVDREGGRASASVSGPVSSADDLLALVGRADEASRQAPVSDEGMPLVAGPMSPDFAQAATDVAAEEFAAVASALGEAFAEAERQGHLLFGFAELHRTTTWLGTTAGTRHRFVQPMGRFEFTAKDRDMVNSAWVGQQTNDFTDVDVAAHHAELQRRLAWGRTRLELPAGRYETILPAGAVLDLLVPVTWELSARDAEEGQTCFAAGEVGRTKVGQRLATLPVTMASDPHLPGLEVSDVAVVTHPQPGLTTVFDNGAPVERIEWLREGELTALVATRRHHQDRGGEGPLPFLADNLEVDGGGTATLDEMIASTKRGLLLTCLWYIRTVDPQTLLLTGLTRDGVYLVEDGEVKGAVNNFRFNESPLSLLSRATEVSRSEKALCREWNDWFTRGVAPAVRVPDFQMSTVSQAY